MNIACRLYFKESIDKNKMKNLIKIAIILPLILLASCTSISTTSPQESPKILGMDGQTKQIMITNYGYYLFNCIPLASGSNADGSFEFFSDKVNLKDAMKSLNDECQKLGTTQVSNVQTEKTSTCFFDWSPLFSSTFGIYWFKEIQLSASINFEKNSQSK